MITSAFFATSSGGALSGVSAQAVPTEVLGLHEVPTLLCRHFFECRTFVNDVLAVALHTVREWGCHKRASPVGALPHFCRLRFPFVRPLLPLRARVILFQGRESVGRLIDEFAE